MADAFSDRLNGPAVPESSGDAPPGTSRALVPLTTPRPKAPANDFAVRPDARFVAQLIATATHAPQTRALRRASADDAMMSYATVRRDAPVPANGEALLLMA
jgi:hypothetical protein